MIKVRLMICLWWRLQEGERGGRTIGLSKSNSSKTILMKGNIWNLNILIALPNLWVLSPFLLPCKIFILSYAFHIIFYTKKSFDELKHLRLKHLKCFCLILSFSPLSPLLVILMLSYAFHTIEVYQKIYQEFWKVFTFFCHFD